MSAMHPTARFRGEKETERRHGHRHRMGMEGEGEERDMGLCARAGED